MIFKKSFVFIITFTFINIIIKERKIFKALNKLKLKLNSFKSFKDVLKTSLRNVLFSTAFTYIITTFSLISKITKISFRFSSRRL